MAAIAKLRQKLAEVENYIMENYDPKCLVDYKNEGLGILQSGHEILDLVEAGDVHRAAAMEIMTLSWRPRWDFGYMAQEAVAEVARLAFEPTVPLFFEREEVTVPGVFDTRHNVVFEWFGQYMLEPDYLNMESKKTGQILAVFGEAIRNETGTHMKCALTIAREDLTEHL